MFSNLGPLFKATMRQAEQVDTRMAIRKDDPRDQENKKDAPDDDDTGSDLWEDSMGVSIEALRAFLTNFVEGKTAHVAQAGEAGTGAATVPPPPAPETRMPQNTQTARAMQAYQSMAGKTAGAYHQPPVAPISDVDLVHAEDVRVIHALIADLAALAAAGYETLPLEKSDTFLHALQEAVARLKSGV